MTLYVCESASHSVEHRGHVSAGVLGEQRGTEHVYLHVLALPDADVAALAPRVDEHGNTEHARLALPRNEDWWVALDGEVCWPKLHRPRISSRCDLSTGSPRPVPLSEEDAARLRKLGVQLP